MSEKLSGRCPGCGALLVYNAGDSTVMCNVCDVPHSVKELETGAKVAKSTAAASKVSFGAMLGFDNPESGVVYLENFFDTYNWAEYQDLPEIEIEEIAEVVENNKIKNGANGQSWYLVFKSISVPVAKKIAGLKAQADAMGAKYNAEDGSESLAIFDNYRKVISALSTQKDQILLKLENAVKYAEKFALDGARLAEIKKELQEVSKALATVKEVKTIDDVAEYIAAQDKASEVLAKTFAEKGIDAKTTYADAIALYRAGGMAKRDALLKFESIRGYKDSVNYINKTNNYFDFNTMFHFFDKYYIYKKESFALPTLNIKELGKKVSKKAKKAEPVEEQPATTTALSLYEIVNGVPAAKPIIKGIEKFITCYNNNYYYFKVNQGIFSFDLNTLTETCVDAGVSADYKDGGEYQVLLAINGTKAIVKKKLHPIEKKGCLGFFKKKKEEEKLLNNYCLLTIDLLTGVVSTAINEFVDIADTYDKEIFYILAERHAKSKAAKGSFLAKLPLIGKFFAKGTNVEEEKDYETKLMVCDLVTGDNKQVLSEGCEIHTVYEKKIVYSIWKPNEKNIDLRVFNMNTGEDVLIEDNAYRFFGVYGGRVFYTIGNASYRPLISNDFAGADRVEIMQNVENVIDVRAGWLYVKKGRGDNAIIVKVSMDGTKRVVVCTQYKRTVKATATHIYYINSLNELRVVRRDGEGNNLIGENITWAVIEKNFLFYVRRELVEANTYNLSLYRMDIDGKNVKKVVFNLADAVNYDEDTLYFYKKEALRFKVTVPVGKDKFEDHYEHHSVTRYFKYDKNTGTSEVVMTLGLPTSKTATFKAGCLGKKTAEGEVTYTEVPEIREFRRKGLKAVGAVEKEEEQKKENSEPSKTSSAPVATKKQSFIDKIVAKVKSIFKK